MLKNVCSVGSTRVDKRRVLNNFPLPAPLRGLRRIAADARDIVPIDFCGDAIISQLMSWLVHCNRVLARDIRRNGETRAKHSIAECSFPRASQDNEH